MVADPRDPSAEDLDRAGACVRHFVGCALVGADLPWSAAALRTAAAHPVSDDFGATTIGLPERSTPQLAVFANAVLGQSTLAEDVHVPSLVHPGSIVIPAALAAAELVGASTDRLLRAVVVGYDAVAAIGAAMKTPQLARRGWRPSGVFGPFGSAAAVSAVLGHDYPTTLSALAIAGNLGAGTREWATAGSTDIYVQNGTAAWNGYFAAVLAGEGMTGPASLLDGPAGLSTAVSGPVDWSGFTRLRERPAAVHDIEFKRFPACSGVQAVLELALRTAREDVVSPQDVRAVTVHTHHHGKTNPGCDSVGPWTSIGQAQMSNQLGVAMTMFGSSLLVTDYARMHDQEPVLALARRIQVVEDPALTAAYPGRSGARLVIEMTDGSIIERTLDRAAPLSAPEVDEFAERAVAASVPDSSRAARLMDALTTLTERRPVHDLLASLRPAR
jgi:2-methylcitrate dehydratase PrpD